jgi:acyl-CoA synthetase (AMP-forming)/AMP-acid ligase II
VLGQAVKAVITLQEGAHLTQNDVLRHCTRHLENFMVPTLVEFCDTMPKTATGKIDRRELAAQQRLVPQ